MKLIKGRTMVGIGVILVFALLMVTHMAQAATSPACFTGDGNTSANPEFVMLRANADSGVFGEFFRNFPDGTTATQAFQVPIGKVLVVTDINVRTNGLTDAVLVFYIVSLTDFHTKFPVSSIKLADAFGDASTTQSLTTGFVVSAKAQIFTQIPSGHGTFAGGDILIKGYLRPAH